MDDPAAAGEDEPESTLDERRARVHAKAQEAIDAMRDHVNKPEDQQRPVPQVQRVGHRAERHERRGGQQPVGERQLAAGVRVGQPVGRRSG